MKIGCNISIDVTKLDKARFYQGLKGTYVNLTAFINTENPGQYGDHGPVRQQTSKEERDNGVDMPICGNVKVFWTGESEREDYTPPVSDAGNGGGFDDDIPF